MKIERNVSIGKQNTSISGVKSGWTSLYIDQAEESLWNHGVTAWRWYNLFYSFMRPSSVPAHTSHPTSCPPAPPAFLSFIATSGFNRTYHKVGHSVSASLYLVKGPYTRVRPIELFCVSADTDYLPNRYADISAFTDNLLIFNNICRYNRYLQI